MTFQRQGLRLRGIPGPIIASVAILWTWAAIGMYRSGTDWIEHSERGGDPFTAIILVALMAASLVNAVLGLAIQLRRGWARSWAISLGLVRTVAALIAIVAGHPSYVSVAVNVAVVVLLILPSAAVWCDR
ncbi:hypothetical protein GCM10027447_34280 [Glycomyces halotolerans]